MRLRPLDFEAFPGWTQAEAAAAWPAFRASSAAIVGDQPALRAGLDPPAAMSQVCRAALDVAPDPGEIDRFLRDRFRPYQVSPDESSDLGFVTGYYEPEIEGSLVRTPDFIAPVFSRPGDLIDTRGMILSGWDRRLEGARYGATGELEPYPDRAAIEAGEVSGQTIPVVWLRDQVEVFFAQVQGSARVYFADGTSARLIYDGRNGRPYSSIGRALIEAGEIPADEMSLARCKSWLRANGLEVGASGRAAMQRNQSYVFFRLEIVLDAKSGPIGAQGVPLSPLRSIAVDRNIWPYGTPVWIGANLTSAGLGSGPSGRLLISQDTGSAIVGPARGDLFIGSGAVAGDIAGKVRHSAQFVVLLPTGIKP